MLVAWQDAVFALYLAEEKIEPEVVENMRSWQHSGFSVDQSVFLPAGDQQAADASTTLRAQTNRHWPETANSLRAQVKTSAVVFD